MEVPHVKKDITMIVEHAKSVPKVLILHMEMIVINVLEDIFHLLQVHLYAIYV